MKYHPGPVLVAAALLLPAAASCVEQPPLNRTSPPYVRATGDATVSAKPDRARLTIGVVTQSASAQAAAAQNAKQTETVLESLRRSAGAAAQLRTSGYSLTPDFSYPKNNSPPVISGYTASNIVDLTTADLANVGKVIDAATQAGANKVPGIEFLLKDEVAVRAEALREAAQKARENSQAMAAALGLKIVRVLSAEEGEPQVIRPMRMMAMAPAMNATTPIESGNIQVQATVTVTVEVVPIQ